MTAKVIVGMTTSLDGFISDRNGALDGMYDDIEELSASDEWKSMIKETGAVVMGKKSFEMAEPDSYADTYEFQVPIFVVTHKPPKKAPKHNKNLNFSFVTDGVESAIAQAKLAAGDKAVQVVGGADVIQQVLKAGLADELTVDVMPVLYGAGQRLLDDPELAKLKLEKIDAREVTAGGPRTMLRFRVK